MDEAEFRSLPASIAAARAYRALALGDISGTKMYARQALALDPEGDSIHHTQAISLLGIAEYASGDLPAAEQELRKFQAIMWQANDIANAIGITFILANIKLVQGRLREAVSAYRQSLQLAVSRGAPSFLGASDLHRGLSELLCEQGDLEAAAQHLLTAQQLGEQGATNRLAASPMCCSGAHEGISGRSGWRSRFVGRGGAPVCQESLTRSSHRGVEGADVGQAGQVDRSSVVGARTEPIP